MAIRWKFIAELVQRLGIKQEDLASRIGISREHLSRLLSGYHGDMKWSTAIALSRELGIPLESMIDREMSAGDGPNVMELGEAREVYRLWSNVPIVAKIGAASASLNLAFSDGDYPPGFGPYGSVEVPAKDQSDFALLVEGDSMEPVAPEGSIVVLSDRLPFINGSMCAIQAIDGRAWLKRVRRLDGIWLLESYNSSAYPPFTLQNEEVKHVWRVALVRYQK